MDGEICFVNIGPKGRRKRAIGGIAAFVAAGLLAVWLIMSGMPRGARLLVFVPAFLGAMGVLQARAKT